MAAHLGFFSTFHRRLQHLQCNTRWNFVSKKHIFFFSDISLLPECVTVTLKGLRRLGWPHVFFFRRYTEHNLIIHLNSLSFELVVNEEVCEGELELF